MTHSELPRREFLKTLAGAFAVTALDWDSLPRRTQGAGSDYDAIIIGSGLGGLSCAAAFARQGFRPLVLEQHDKPGGYATAFARPGGFLFDVSLHSTSVGERDGMANLIQGFPEITGLEFVLHPTLFRSIYPEHDLRVAQKKPEAFVETLVRLFPAEQQGIAALFEDMRGLARDISRLSAARGKVDMSHFATEFPFLDRYHDKTWGAMVDTHIKDTKLKALVSAQWGYYGLPPSKLSCFYYALPFMGYLQHGGFYPRGRSQDISNAFARYITDKGGTVKLNTRVKSIEVKDQTAKGVMTTDGKAYGARVVVSNANAFDTFRGMIDDGAALVEYEAAWKDYSVSLSSFQIFLGLKHDLVGALKIPDSEIFLESSYDPELSYQHALQADVEHAGIGVTLYDNIFPGYSPEGKNTLNLIALQGYAPWEKFEEDYRAGNKDRYRTFKEHMAQTLIQKAEEALLPGLSGAIEVIEIGTPLTNVRYTSNYRGAIYGWDQTVNNSGSRRVGHATPIKNLYLAGAWSRPGHGYGAVIPSGLECFGEIMRSW